MQDKNSEPENNLGCFDVSRFNLLVDKWINGDISSEETSELQEMQDSLIPYIKF